MPHILGSDDFFNACILIDLALWTLFFVYHFIRIVIKKFKRQETNLSLFDIICFLILAVGSSIFGPVTLAIFVIFGFAGIVSEIAPWLWDHIFEPIIGWLCSIEI